MGRYGNGNATPHIKRNKTGSFEAMRMDLETIIQSEVSQRRGKQVSYIYTYMWNLIHLHIHVESSP